MTLTPKIIPLASGNLPQANKCSHNCCTKLNIFTLFGHCYNTIAEHLNLTIKLEPCNLYSRVIYSRIQHLFGEFGDEKYKHVHQKCVHLTLDLTLLPASYYSRPFENCLHPDRTTQNVKCQA